jgi:hypothetical protein
VAVGSNPAVQTNYSIIIRHLACLFFALDVVIKDRFELAKIQREGRLAKIK